MSVAKCKNCGDEYILHTGCLRCETCIKCGGVRKNGAPHKCPGAERKVIIAEWTSEGVAYRKVVSGGTSRIERLMQMNKFSPGWWETLVNYGEIKDAEDRRRGSALLPGYDAVEDALEKARETIVEGQDRTATEVKDAMKCIKGPDPSRIIQPVVDQVLEILGLPTDAATRKATPIFSGVLRYFPDALAAVAELSRIGNEQHNPGEPLHWARSKSGDEWDALTRHLLEVGTIDTDGVRHAAKVAWRALAGLQKEIELAAGVDKSDQD